MTKEGDCRLLLGFDFFRALSFFSANPHLALTIERSEGRPKRKRQDWPKRTKEDEKRIPALRLYFFRLLSLFSAKFTS